MVGTHSESVPSRRDQDPLFAITSSCAGQHDTDGATAAKVSRRGVRDYHGTGVYTPNRSRARSGRQDEAVEFDPAAYYDALGDAEIDRLTASLTGRVSFEIHRRFLHRFVRPGDRVLEIGAGPGLFTTELGAIGARVAVTDISPVQLVLNERELSGTPAEHAVESRALLDVRDTSQFSDGEFDAVLAYGGPLSYAFDAEDQALRGLLRITRPEGPVVGSVMSLLGTWRQFLPGVIAADPDDVVLISGDLRLLGGQHQCRLYRWSDIPPWVHRCGGELLAGSASGWASHGDPAALATLEADLRRWRQFLDQETRACAEPGARDGGTHILFAARSAG